MSCCLWPCRVSSPWLYSRSSFHGMSIYFPWFLSTMKPSRLCHSEWQALWVICMSNGAPLGCCRGFDDTHFNLIYFFTALPHQRNNVRSRERLSLLLGSEYSLALVPLC